jgi:hypothetical protein
MWRDGGRDEWGLSTRVLSICAAPAVLVKRCVAGKARDECPQSLFPGNQRHSPSLESALVDVSTSVRLVRLLRRHVDRHRRDHRVAGLH